MNNINSLQSALSEQRHYAHGIIMNRVTLATSVLLGLVLYTDTTFDNRALPLIFGGFWITEYGKKTLIFYHRTLEHIQEFDCLDERFFSKIVSKCGKNRLMGYCELQGIYLAAKECGIQKRFFELKKKYCRNIVPNF